METDKKLDLGILIVRSILGMILFLIGLNMITGFYPKVSLYDLMMSLINNGVIYPEIVSVICLASFIVIGVSLILGILVRGSSIVGIIVVLFFIIFLQWKNGFSVYTGGIEYSLLILSNFILLLLTGAGRYSLSRGK